MKNNFMSNECSECSEQHCNNCAVQNILGVDTKIKSTVKTEMNMLRARLFTLLESQGFTKEREDALKIIIRDYTGAAWDAIVKDIFEMNVAINTSMLELAHIELPKNDELEQVEDEYVDEVIEDYKALIK